MDIQAAYQKTLDSLYEQLPMFSRIGKAALKYDLNNTLKLCEALGNPERKFKSIHITGTNGKGSTSHMMAAILQKAGYKTGLYTSPHLIDFRERIRINGAEISKEWIVDFVAKHQQLINEIKASFFEITVAMAFDYFAQEEIDIAVIETGLGGRLDSTNVISPILSIITNISYDHKDLLGNTLGEIAAEKAGIIKPGIPAVIGEQHVETERVFFEHAMRNRSTLYYAEALWDLVKVKEDAKYQYFKAIHGAHREMYDLATDLQGSYQAHNIKTVLAAVEVLIVNQGLNLSIPDAINALSSVKKLTGIQGRWQLMQENPTVITDVAHNTAGITEVMRQWDNLPAARKHIVVGFVKDKEISEALSLFPANAIYYFCNAQLPRALPAEELKEKAARWGLQGNAYETVTAAVKAAMDNMKEEDAMLVTGSFFIVGEFLEYFQQKENTAKM